MVAMGDKIILLSTYFFTFFVEFGLLIMYDFRISFYTTICSVHFLCD